MNVSDEEVWPRPANPFLRGMLRPESGVFRINTALQDAYPRSLDQREIMKATGCSKGMTNWCIRCLLAAGMVRSVPSVGRSGNLRYRAVLSSTSQRPAVQVVAKPEPRTVDQCAGAVTAEPDKRNLPEGDMPAIEKARMLLMSMLADRPRAAKEVIAVAERQGIHERTLQRASKNIGILKTKDGFSAGWNWTRPETEPAST
jgi:hypothetical protein